MSTSLFSKTLLFILLVGISLQAEYDSSWSKKFIAESTIAFIAEVDYFREDESVHFSLIKQLKGKSYIKSLTSVLQVCCGVRLKPYAQGLRPGQHYLIILNEQNARENYVGDMNIRLIQKNEQEEQVIYNKFDSQKFEWRSLKSLIKQVSKKQTKTETRK